MPKSDVLRNIQRSEFFSDVVTLQNLLIIVFCKRELVAALEKQQYKIVTIRMLLDYRLILNSFKKNFT